MPFVMDSIEFPNEGARLHPRLPADAHAHAHSRAHVYGNARADARANANATTLTPTPSPALPLRRGLLCERATLVPEVVRLQGEHAGHPGHGRQLRAHHLQRHGSRASLWRWLWLLLWLGLLVANPRAC